MQDMHHAADKLNGLLRGEMSAVETYRQAIEKIDDPVLRAELTETVSCHSDRVRLLTEQVHRMGAEPAHSSGAWGGFAKLMEGGATAFGSKAAIDMLEEGEDKGLKDYRKLADENDVDIQAVVREMLPRQEWSHKRMSDLKHRLQ